MRISSSIVRSFSLALPALVLACALAAAQPAQVVADDKPVTPPDTTRILMENDRVRMIEFHIKPRSKVNVEAPPNRERFLYMLTDGALVLAPPGRAPYEFALHAGETVLFPAVSPTVENDSDQPVRALMVEIKQPTRSAAPEPRGKRRYAKSKTTRGKPSGKKPRKKKRR
jgi:quercetin dioxygenase-like cupin family protein